MSQSEKPSAIAPSTATSMTQLDDNIKRIKTTGGATPSLSASTLTQDEKTAEEQADGVDLEKKETYVSLHAPQSFPDGGYAAWACTFGAFCCLFCSFGWINAIGIFQGYYEANQLKDYSASTIAWIGSLEAFCMFFGGAFIGKIFDAYGPRYILLVGTFMHVFGIMMASISYEYWHFILSQGICSALGASMVFYPAVGCVSTWFHRRRAFALGVTVSGSSLGGVIFPIMLRRLIISVGFGWAMRITAFLILFMCIIANLTLRSRLPPKGYTPWRFDDLFRHFKEVPFMLLVLASFLFFFGMFLPFNYLPVFGQAHGMSVDMSNYLIAILNGASVFGRLSGGLGDIFGRFNWMIVITAMSGILVFALWLPGTGSIPTIFFAALYGFSTGAFVSLAPALTAQISDIREIGLRNGALFMVCSLAALTGNPIGGALLTRYDGGFRGLQIFAGSVIMAGVVVFILARIKLGGVSLRTVI